MHGICAMNVFVKKKRNRLFTMFSRYRSLPSQYKKFILSGEALRNDRNNGTEKKTKERMQVIQPSDHSSIYQLTAYQSQTSLGHSPS